ncbi:MAG: glycosyltransferase [Xanthomonadales bacterium]|nr:glycosyltransferase [Xanthomonadales bacterium]
MSTSDTHIIHDMFQIKGGGERLVLALCDGLNADLTTAFIGKNTFDLGYLGNRLNNLDALSGLHGIKTWSLTRSFKKYQSSHRYHSIIYSGVASPLAINNLQAAHHVFYCHTPPRFVYDKKQHYAEQFNPLKRLFFKQLINWFQPQYEQAVGHMDAILTNSRYVQDRIKRTLNMDAKVVYPPCDTQKFKWIEQGDYYLSMARHDGLKRVDAIINAFLQMPDKKLVVASGGQETIKLKKLAGNAPNITFTGWLSETAMLELLGNCLATIYVPLDEDFGMTPVESMSAGKPVFCSNHGGLLETVIDGETGYLVSCDALTEDLVKHIKKFSKTQAYSMKTACEHRAKQFDTQLFIKKIKEFL